MDTSKEEHNTDSNPKVENEKGFCEIEEDSTDSNPKAISPPKPMKELVPTFPCLADLTR
ncbi:hypothetical protein A2U01_0046165 [Trifolium medium]|uniref:Uncharacterized protein n=1 Tax=Trifolium medium TaxID=97028 RepID=A0A392QM10_9FABA|nr:hypothetical protein [Trifolium medium]